MTHKCIFKVESNYIEFGAGKSSWILLTSVWERAWARSGGLRMNSIPYNGRFKLPIIAQNILSLTERKLVCNNTQWKNTRENRRLRQGSMWWHPCRPLCGVCSWRPRHMGASCSATSAGEEENELECQGNPWKQAKSTVRARHQLSILLRKEHVTIAGSFAM